MPLTVMEELNEKGQQYHICCKPGDVGRYVLLPGDPFRTDYIASFLDDAKLVAHNREHKTWTGSLCGVPVSVTSTGMGGPSAAIAIEELIHCGADTFIRIGTAGRLCPESQDTSIQGIIATGDQFINNGEVRSRIHGLFGAKAVEMEGGAVAHACYANGILKLKMEICFIKSMEMGHV